jgi:hypothetical protein
MNMILQIDSLLLPLNKNSLEASLKQALSDRISKGVEYRLRLWEILNTETDSFIQG